MSKQRRQRLNRNKRTRSRRSFIRIGVEQLERRIQPGGFLDLLAGAAIASTFDLLPEQQLVPEEIESESNSFTVRDRSASTLLQTGSFLPNIDREANEERVELAQTDDEFGFVPTSRAVSNTPVAAAFVDSFFAGNQLVDATHHRPVSPPQPTPSRPFSSPIRQLGAGVGVGSGQGYNMTGAELPQSNVSTPAKVAFAMPAWMMGEGESSSCGGSASGSSSMSAVASGVVSVSDAAASESAGTITFTLSFSGTATCGFTVDYHTEDGSAIAVNPTVYPWDYIGVAMGDGSVAFSGNDGETKTVTIGIIDDQIVERDETFTLVLDSVHDGDGGQVEGEGAGIAIGSGSGSASGSGTGMGGGGSATGTILNDDQAIVTIVGETYTGGPEGTLVNFTRVYGLHIDKEVDVDVIVGLSTIDGTATKADGDFGDVPASVTIPQGLQSRLFEIPVTPDWKIELDETFQIKIDSVTASERNVIPTTTPFTDTIVNDDIGSIRLATVIAATGQEVSPSYPEDDWGALEFRAILVHQEFPSHSVSVDTAIDLSVTTTDATASVNLDYTNGGTIPLPVGAGYVVLPVTVTADTIVEVNETFGLEIGIANAYQRDISASGSLTATIEGDDYAKVSISPSSLEIFEGAAGTFKDLTFTISLDATTDRIVTVGATVDGSASPGPAGQDYLVLDEGPFDLGGTAGNSKTMKVRVYGDDVVEPNENFQITLGSLSTNGLGSFVTIDSTKASSTVTIKNDD